MNILCTFLLLILPSLISSQVLPDLPDLPSPSPPPTPTPLPSALLDILNSSQVQPTAVPPDRSVTPSPQSSKEASTLKPPTAPNATPVPPNTPQPSPSSAPTPNFINEDGICQRDVSQPRPKLGKSQKRYALAVLVSTAAIGVASILYSGVNAWKKHEDYAGLRFFGIVIARVLLFGAVRLSAALVASITKASPDDGALDASGAFLTWGTAIFTRAYNEGIVMTLAALGLAENEGSWDDKLEQFLNEKYTTKLESDEDGSVRNIDTSATQPDVENKIEHRSHSTSVWRLIFGGKWERKLLVLTAIMYFVQEIAVLISNVLTLVGSFEVTEAGPIFFTPDDGNGQCPFSATDIRTLGAVVFLQFVYALTYQPSLAPLLRVSGFHNIRFCCGLRWIAWLVLLGWVVSLLTMPLLNGDLHPFFMGGDISLFWFVFFAPPSYSSTSYIITATYTCLAAAVGATLLFRISQSSKWRENEI